jgi:hypothetical protein
MLLGCEYSCCAAAVLVACSYLQVLIAVLLFSNVLCNNIGANIIISGLRSCKFKEGCAELLRGNYIVGRLRYLVVYP